MHPFRSAFASIASTRLASGAPTGYGPPVPTKERQPGATRFRSIPESQRHTERVVLRLVPALAKRFRACARARGVPMGVILEQALDALEAGGRRSPKRRTTS